MYPLTIIIVFSYFYIAIFLFPFIFLFTLFLFIKTVYIKKEDFNIKNIYIYEYFIENTYLHIIKFYLLDRLIQYSFLLIYIIIQYFKEKDYLIIFKVILANSFRILFIYVFGWPMFLINFVRKVYGRMEECIVERQYLIKRIKLEFSSMKFFDYTEDICNEDKTIKYNKDTKQIELE